MQIKEFQADTLKECLQKVRESMGGEAVILETRKVRKGGVLGWGAKEAILVVAATGVTVQANAGRKTEGSLSPAMASAPQREVALAGAGRKENFSSAFAEAARQTSPAERTSGAVRTERPTASSPLARNLYGSPRETSAPIAANPAPERMVSRPTPNPTEPDPDAARLARLQNAIAHIARDPERRPDPIAVPVSRPVPPANVAAVREETLGGSSLAGLEKALHEIREGLAALRQQQEKQERAVTAVVQSVSPGIGFPSGLRTETPSVSPAEATGFPTLYEHLLDTGLSPELAKELLEELPAMDAWSEEARAHLSRSALRDVIARRVVSAGGIRLTPGRTKAVALIGPTGVGKTTTIAKLAAHFSLVERKRVALITVDTYRIAAVEQLKNYAQIIDIPIGVAYDSADVPNTIRQFADFDLVLIDTAGRSQKNIAQVGELKEMLASVACETHLVMSAHMKERDMLEAIQRFSGARVDNVIFSKLDETNSYGTLLNVLDKAGVPVSYLTMGQKVPEDIETADGRRFADMILG